MNSITAAPPRRVPALDGARTRGIYVEFYDPDGTRYGLPTYPYHWAPKHLAPSGSCAPAACARRPAARRPDPVAQGQARRLPVPHSTWPCPSGRPPLPSSTAIAAALRARRTCPECGRKSPTASRAQRGECNDCAGAVTTMTTRHLNPVTVKTTLTPKRRKRVVENDEYAAFLRRVIRAYSRRVAAGDIDALTAMAALCRRPRHRHPRRHHRAARPRLLLGRHRHPARRHPPGRPAAMGR